MEMMALKRDELWKGCILASIAHAIMVGEYPELAYEHSWDGNNYNIQDSCGCRGTITFHPKYTIAVFQDMHNYEQIQKCKLNSAINYLKCENQEILDIAQNEALQYVLEKIDKITVPLITTAFWGIDNDLYANDKYNIIEKNGAYLIRNQIKSFEEAVIAWAEYYEMSEEQVKLLRVLYSKKNKLYDGKIILNEEEITMLNNLYDEELDSCRESFEEINIYFE